MPKFDAEIKKALSTFENLLKEFDLKQKEGKFLALEKNFSPEFQKKFLKENLLKESDMKQKEEKARKDLKQNFSPEFQQILEATPFAHGQQLQGTVDFFENLLFDKEIKFAREIEALKKNEAALDSKLSVDEKNKKLPTPTIRN